jgi:hypothetical protein
VGALCHTTAAAAAAAGLLQHHAADDREKARDDEKVRQNRVRKCLGTPLPPSNQRWWWLLALFWWLLVALFSANARTLLSQQQQIKQDSLHAGRKPHERDDQKQGPPNSQQPEVRKGHHPEETVFFGVHFLYFQVILGCTCACPPSTHPPDGRAQAQ